MEVEDDKASIFKKKAMGLGLELEQFVLATIEDLLRRPKAEFGLAME